LLEEDPVAAEIKVLVTQELDRLVDELVVQQDGAQNTALGLDVLGEAFFRNGVGRHGSGSRKNRGAFREETRAGTPRDSTVRQAESLLFPENFDADDCSHFAMEFDGHVVPTQRLEGLFQVDLAAVDLEAFFLQGLADIQRSNRAVENVLLSDLAGKLERNLGKLLRQILGLVLLDGFATDGRSLLLFHLAYVVGGGQNSLPLGEQVVASIAGLDGNYLAAIAKLLDSFSQDYVHDVPTPAVRSRERAAEPPAYPAAKGSRAILRARLRASMSLRWQGAQVPEILRGRILPRSGMKPESKRVSL